MSSNYEWQKHQVSEQIQERLHEAEIHRLAKESKDHRPSFMQRLIPKLRAFRLNFEKLFSKHASPSAPEELENPRVQFEK